MKQRFALHGGAGVIDRAHFSQAREREYRAALAEIAKRAWTALSTGARALDVVEQAVADLEDCPYFNAGRGAVLNRAAEVELDASIMDGRDRRCGAVGAVQSPKHPIRLARKVMEQGEHVMLVGPAADRFAAAHGIEQVAPGYFLLPERLEQLKLAQAERRVTLDHDERYDALIERFGRGTVGAVARDAEGHLAAATSTGGMTNKIPGRLGDSPIIGAGTWADDRSCAVSATGHGEFFIRSVLAYDVHARMVYAGQSLAAAADAVLAHVAALGGTGGLIAIAHDGTLVTPFNSPGMYRAWVGADGVLRVAIYAE